MEGYQSLAECTVQLDAQSTAQLAEFDDVAVAFSEIDRTQGTNALAKKCHRA